VGGGGGFWGVVLGVGRVGLFVLVFFWWGGLRRAVGLGRGKPHGKRHRQVRRPEKTTPRKVRIPTKKLGVIF